MVGGTVVAWGFPFPCSWTVRPRAPGSGAGQAARGLGETTLLLRCGGPGDQAAPGRPGKSVGFPL